MTQTLEQIVAEFDPLFASLAGGTAEDRAAIWGQALQESNFNPAAVERPGTNQGGIDLWQHTASRRREYEAFATSQGKPWQDIATQVRFVAQELKSTYAHAWSQICNVAKTLQAKVETAMGLFEAPANWEQEIKNHGSTTANFPRRFDGAKRALAAITAAQPGAKPVTDTSNVATAEVVAEPSGLHKLAQWVQDNEGLAESFARGLLVAAGVSGTTVDTAFGFLNRVNLVALEELFEKHPNGPQFLIGLVGVIKTGKAA